MPGMTVLHCECTVSLSLALSLYRISRQKGGFLCDNVRVYRNSGLSKLACVVILQGDRKKAF